MKTLELILTIEHREQLILLIKNKSLPLPVIKRLEVIRLLDKGCTTAMIAEQLGIRKEIVRKCYTDFLKGGFDVLINMQKPGKNTQLTEEKLKALEEFMKEQKRNKKKYCLKDLTTFLYQTYGISMSEEWLSKRLAMRK